MGFRALITLINQIFSGSTSCLSSPQDYTADYAAVLWLNRRSGRLLWRPGVAQFFLNASNINVAINVSSVADTAPKRCRRLSPPTARNSNI